MASSDSHFRPERIFLMMKYALKYLAVQAAETLSIPCETDPQKDSLQFGKHPHPNRGVLHAQRFSRMKWERNLEACMAHLWDSARATLPEATGLLMHDAVNYIQKVLPLAQQKM